MRIILASDSVHTTAAACDYLANRLDSGDSVVLLTVREPAVTERDAADAANVARVRLAQPVETRTGEGEPAAVIRDVARAERVDEVVVGTVRGDPTLAGDPPGSTVRALLADPPAPVVVLPQ